MKNKQRHRQDEIKKNHRTKKYSKRERERERERERKRNRERERSSEVVSSFIIKVFTGKSRLWDFSSNRSTMLLGTLWPQRRYTSTTFFCFGATSVMIFDQCSKQRTLTMAGSITLWLTPCLTGLHWTKQLKLLLIQHKQSSWIQTNKTRGQPYSYTSP